MPMSIPRRPRKSRYQHIRTKCSYHPHHITPAQYRARPTSRKFPPHFSKSRNRPRGKIAPAHRNTHPQQAVPKYAVRQAHPTNYCRLCSAHPRRDSKSLIARCPRDRATPASAFRHLHHPGAPQSASGVPSCPAVAASTASPEPPDLAEVWEEFPGKAIEENPLLTIVEAVQGCSEAAACAVSAACGHEATSSRGHAARTNSKNEV